MNKRNSWLIKNQNECSIESDVFVKIGGFLKSSSCISGTHLTIVYQLVRDYTNSATCLISVIKILAIGD